MARYSIIPPKRLVNPVPNEWMLTPYDLEDWTVSVTPKEDGTHFFVRPCKDGSTLSGTDKKLAPRIAITMKYRGATVKAWRLNAAKAHCQRVCDKANRRERTKRASAREKFSNGECTSKDIFLMQVGVLMSSQAPELRAAGWKFLSQGPQLVE